MDSASTCNSLIGCLWFNLCCCFMCELDEFSVDSVVCELNLISFKFEPKCIENYIKFECVGACLLMSVAG
jgi:hypothetical protein